MRTTVLSTDAELISTQRSRLAPSSVSNVACENPGISIPVNISGKMKVKTWQS